MKSVPCKIYASRNTHYFRLKLKGSSFYDKEKVVEIRRAHLHQSRILQNQTLALVGLAVLKKNYKNMER